jgi:hypothetical protein
MDWLGFHVGFLVTVAVMFVILCGVAITFWIMQQREMRRYREVLKRFERNNPERRRGPPALAGLPETARRYLAHAISPDGEHSPGVWLQVEGGLCFEPGGSVYQGEAGMLISLETGLVVARSGKRTGQHLLSTEWLLTDTALRTVRLYNLVPLLRWRDEQARRYLRPWLALGACWLPGELVRLPGAVLTEHEGMLVAEFDCLGASVRILLSVNAEGALVSARVPAEYPDSKGGWQQCVLGLDSSEELKSGGSSLPGRFVVGYDLDEPGDRTVLMDVRATDLRYL